MVDLTICSNILPYDSIGKHGIGVLSCVHKDLDTNFMKIGSPNYRDVPAELMMSLAKPFTGFGKVSLWTYILGLNEQMMGVHKKVRAGSPKTIALSMFESDKIPGFWAQIINDYYDQVIVPDSWLIDVFQNSGVKKPITVIPLGCCLEPFLNAPPHQPSGPFTFGLSAGAWQRKNMVKLIQAFSGLYRNNPAFQLKLHVRFGPHTDKIQEAVVTAKTNNISIKFGPMSDKEYLEFMKTLDCVVIPSQGEGYGIPAREAIALGIPAIVSNNTAHKTICDSGLVVPLKADIKMPAIYEVFGNKQIGNYFDCIVQDLQDRMDYVVENYSSLLEKSITNREYARQFLWSSLRDKYLEALK